MARTLKVGLEWLCDESDTRLTPPPPSPSEDEAAILETVRGLGLDRNQAILRLGNRHPDFMAARVRTPEETAREAAASELPPARKTGPQPLPKRKPG